MMTFRWMIALLMCGGVGAGPLMAEEADPAGRLSGTTWTLTLRPVDAAQDAPVRQDTISFEGRRMRAEELAQDGYPSSNCTVRLTADGALTWETMQTKSGEGVVFWRGELRGDRMSGVLTKQPDVGAPQHFSFTASPTTESASSEPKTEPAALAPAIQQPAPANPHAVKPPQKKKRWWLW